jgi:hypothetical protein
MAALGVGEPSAGPGPDPAGGGASALAGTGAGANAGASAANAGAGSSANNCSTPGALPMFHRLNRIEYQNSVNGLLGTKLPLADSLPVDSLVNGFDNNADVSMTRSRNSKSASKILRR